MAKRSMWTLGAAALLACACNERASSGAGGGSSSEYPSQDGAFVKCTMAAVTSVGSSKDTDVECTAKVDVQLGNVEAVVSDVDQNDTTIGRAVLQREDEKLAKGKSKKFHLHLNHQTLFAGHRAETRLEATVRPDFDGKGSLGDYLDKLAADKAKNPLAYKVLVSRLTH